VEGRRVKVAAIRGADPFGQRCVAALQAAGHEVLEVLHPAAGGLEPELRDALAGVEAVALLSGRDAAAGGDTGVREALFALHTNAFSVVRVLLALAGAPQLRGVVYASRADVYGPAGAADAGAPVSEGHPTRPASHAGAARLAAEHYLRLFGQDRRLPCVSLRLAPVYGPGLRGPRELDGFLRDALRGRAPRVPGDGQERRDLVYVSDAADAVVRAATFGVSGEVNVGSGGGHTLLELAAAASHAAGAPAPVVGDAPGRLTPGEPVLDTGRATRELGFVPRTALQTGVAAQLAWMRAEG
jgi:UDP-glucose 4-epimerase